MNKKVENGKYVYYGGDKDQMMADIRKYADKKQEMDKFLERLIEPFIKDKNLKILDAGCGIGHVLNLLNKISPQSEFLGTDQTDFFIEEAKKRYGNHKNINFEIGDIKDLPLKHHKDFDITVCRGVLSWLPHYDLFVKALMNITKKYIFISSLFYDGDIDFEIKIKEYKRGIPKEGFTEYRNVYSLPRFKKFVMDLGAKNIEVFNFDIGIDLPKGPIDKMSTYTMKLENGERLQISGIVLMNWKWIRIDL